jgi:hypothetical protein
MLESQIARKNLWDVFSRSIQRLDNFFYLGVNANLFPLSFRACEAGKAISPQ